MIFLIILLFFYNYSVTSIAFRYSNGVIKLWNCLKPKNGPIKTITGMNNDYPTANVEFSPDNKFICCGTSAIRTEHGSKCRLYFYDVESENSDPIINIAVSENASVTMTKWHVTTNQIFCCLSTGDTKVLYNPLVSKKGALLSSIRQIKRELDASDFIGNDPIGEIVNPNALPMFRKDNQMAKVRKRVEDLKDPIISKIPQQPAKQGPGSRENTSFFFTNYITGKYTSHYNTVTISLLQCNILH